MNPLFFDLLNLMKEETGQHKELLDLLYRENRAMKNLSLEEMSKCSKLKETIVLKLRMMEELRLSLVEKIADYLEISKDEITLLKIARVVKTPLADEFRRCHQVLSSLVQDIREMNKKNKMFIEHSLESINGYLGLLNNLINPNPVYLSTGKFHKGNRTGNRMIHKEV